jgi:hypothetical protein
MSNTSSSSQQQMSPLPPQQQSPSPATAASRTTSGTGADVPQPTVRVMRLYKPALHIAPCLPQLNLDQLFEAENPLETKSNDSEFTVSQFLLLPDSFGDIYMGELFSAYISVVNGVELPFHQVTLSVRLQTMNAAHDLYDARATPDVQSGFAKVLSPHQSTDMVVQHALSELGTHTLKVSVIYTDTITSESKTLRKFYRFNVLSPVNILTSCYEFDSKICVQSQVINTTKSVIHIEDVKVVGVGPTSELETVAVPIPSSTDVSTDSLEKDMRNLLSMPLLNPDESFAYSFIINKTKMSNLTERSMKSIGFLEVHWSSSMGEHGRSRSDEIFTDQKASFLMPFPPSSAHINRPPNGGRVSGVEGGRSGQLLACVTQFPSEAVVGVPVEIEMSVRNCFSYPVITQLQCRKSNAAVGQTGVVIMGKSFVNLGPLDPGEEVSVSLSLLPLSSGLHSLTDVVLVDLTTRTEFPMGSKFEIMVCD